MSAGELQWRQAAVTYQERAMKAEAENETLRAWLATMPARTYPESSRLWKMWALQCPARGGDAA